MSTQSVCFRETITNIFDWYSLLSREMIKFLYCNCITVYCHPVVLDKSTDIKMGIQILGKKSNLGPFVFKTNDIIS